MLLTKQDEQKLSRALEFDPATSCITWTGSILNTGYGYLYSDTFKKNIPIHRLVMMKHLKRELNTFEYVCHACSNKLCANIEHLYIGTPQENTGHYYEELDHIPSPNVRGTQVSSFRLDDYTKNYIKYVQNKHRFKTQTEALKKIVIEHGSIIR